MIFTSFTDITHNLIQNLILMHTGFRLCFSLKTRLHLLAATFISTCALSTSSTSSDTTNPNGKHSKPSRLCLGTTYLSLIQSPNWISGIYSRLVRPRLLGQPSLSLSLGLFQFQLRNFNYQLFLLPRLLLPRLMSLLLRPLQTYPAYTSYNRLNRLLHSRSIFRKRLRQSLNKTPF